MVGVEQIALPRDGVIGGEADDDEVDEIVGGGVASHRLPVDEGEVPRAVDLVVKEQVLRAAVAVEQRRRLVLERLLERAEEAVELPPLPQPAADDEPEARLCQIPGGGAVLVSRAFYETPAGVDVTGVGLTPDAPCATGEEAMACAKKALLPPDELGYVRTP